MIRSTLLSDGSSDRVLLPVLRWVTGQATTTPVEVQWADLRPLRTPPRTLAARIAATVQLFPCDLLFVHRDAEAQDPQLRWDEVAAATEDAAVSVPVVPVRMQEAWLLFDETALRLAAGRPSGTGALALPPLGRVESLPDPKAVLHKALLTASGLHGRRSRQFRPDAAAHRLADLIEDWSPLRKLPAFRRLEEETRGALASLGCELLRI